MRKERYIRKLLKNCFGEDLQWVEVSRGGTVGMPDCNIKFGVEEIKVELKYLEMTKHGLQCHVRPAQNRYHRMAARKGIKTALLWAKDIPGSFKEFEIHLAWGGIYPKDTYEHTLLEDSHFIGYNLEDKKVLRTKIERAFGAIW